MAQNPFASLFSGFSQPASAYSTPFSMSGYIDSLKKKSTPAVATKPTTQVPYASNPGATAAVTPPIPAPASSGVKSTAGQDYLKSISATTPATTPMTTPSGLPIMGDPSKYAGVGATGGSTTGTPPASTDDPATVDYKAAFADYLKALAPSDAETAASKNLADLQLQAQKDQEDALDRGETLGFATGEAARVNKNNSFGITAASNALDALTKNRTSMTDAEKARLDFTKSLLPAAPKAAEPFTLSPGEVRYDASGKPIASGGAKPLSQAQEQNQIDTAKAATSAQQSASQTIGLVNNLLNSKADISGVQNPLNFILGGAGTGNAQAINQYNQLQGLLKLGIRGLLKGQGAVSDFEGRLLGSAASSLGRNLGDAEFKEALQTVRGVLQTNNGQSVQVQVTDKDGNVFTGTLNGQDIYDAVSDGATVKYL